MQTRSGGHEKLSKALERCSLFSNASPASLQSVTHKAEIITAPRGRLIMQRGDRTTETYILVSGSVIGQLHAGNGREIMFMEIGPTGYFGELAALDGAERSITISASSDCIFAKLSKPDFLDLIRTDPQIALNLATDLANRIRNMNERVFGLVIHDVETRVQIRLMQLAQAQEQLVQGGLIENMPTHEGLAAFVGSNREAVSRAMARMNKSGVIETARRKVTIKNLDQLLRFSDTDL